MPGLFPVKRLAHVGHIHRNLLAARAARAGADRIRRNLVYRLPQRVVAADETQAGQRHMLPGPGLFVLVVTKCIEAHGNRARPAGGTQAHVDLVQLPFCRRRREAGDQALRQPGEPVLRIVRTGIVDHDQVQIGAGGHLLAAELAHAEHRPAARHLPITAGRLLFADGGHVPDGVIGEARPDLRGFV